MSRSKLEVYEKLYAAAFKATATAAEGVAPDARMRQAATGKAHPLWLLGHLTFAADSILNGVVLGGSPTVPKEYRTLFGPDMIGGAPPSPDAASYPAWDDLLAAYRATTAKTLQLLAQQDDAALAGGPKGKVPPGFEDFFKSFEGILNTFLLHDSYHRGQLVHLSKLPAS